MTFGMTSFLLPVALWAVVQIISPVKTSMAHADGLRSSSPLLRNRRKQSFPESADDRKLTDVSRSLGIDTDLNRYMHSALVTKMTTQRMVGGTLVIDGEVVSFDDEHLENVRVTSDGTNANVYKVKPSGRDGRNDSHSTIRVLKKPDDGKVVYVSVHVIATGERIGVEAIGGDESNVYAMFSTKDLDREAVKEMKIESIYGDDIDNNANVTTTTTTTTTTTEHRNSNRALQSSGTCKSYKVIRMNARFDAGFCASYGGNRQNAIDRINFIVSEFNDSYMEYPLCTKVETCGVSGTCNVANDEFVPIISNADGFCGGNVPLVDSFRKHIYKPGTLHSTLYPNGECDTTMLFFGNDVNGNDWFPDTNTVGCAYTGAICGSYSVGVNQVGQFSNVAAQSVLVAHELGHQLNANHDNFEGFVMTPSFCTTCSNIPESFSSVSVNAMFKYIAKKDSPTCVGFEVAGPTSAPAPTPAPTPQPTPAPVPAGSGACGGYYSFIDCYYGGCVWNGACLSESQATCEDLTDIYHCIYNGLECGWDTAANQCIEYSF